MITPSSAGLGPPNRFINIILPIFHTTDTLETCVSSHMAYFIGVLFYLVFSWVTGFGATENKRTPGLALKIGLRRDFINIIVEFK